MYLLFLTTILTGPNNPELTTCCPLILNGAVVHVKGLSAKTVLSPMILFLHILVISILDRLTSLNACSTILLHSGSS